MRTAYADCQHPEAVAQLVQGLAPSDTAKTATDNPDQTLELVLLFISPLADIARIAAEACAQFAPVTVVGCTTAGEISQSGYGEGGIVAVGFPKSHFTTCCTLIETLDTPEIQTALHQIIRNRRQMTLAAPDWESEFAFLMVDGLSRREDTLTAQLAPGLGPVPLFGGSAGDGDAFQQTSVLYDGKVFENAAVLTQVRSICPVKVFKADNLTPTNNRMVVTAADPGQRLVHEINAEPAARELARILGKDPEQLSTYTFAAHPLLVRLGDQHHVRAIQQVAPDGSLVFFSAIDEGMVLALADQQDMVTHLQKEMQSLGQQRAPDMILACDCLLRRIDAEQKQQTNAVSHILSANRVFGFSTYGEQVNSMHVNQTLTGVAIYPPPDLVPTQADVP
ncbi:FIST N-terminal domain-containing protein [Parasedimentitalea maritima]|uniref:GfdT protein n=1 Tax=Parasedimentitalea maritima TaxID=2578117 RepID=A0A6A4R923_9RHOB|nr:FIST N-terminal domain-containing protein [Zongyanglinia marina]KAE9628335.1 GfdT protein [Zongyanglinia marina]